MESPRQMTLLLILASALVAAASALPTSIFQYESPHMEHEQKGVPGRAVRGEYSWTAPNGEEVSITYVADKRGYRIVESKNRFMAVDDWKDQKQQQQGDTYWTSRSSYKKPSRPAAPAKHNTYSSKRGRNHHNHKARALSHFVAASHATPSGTRLLGSQVPKYSPKSYSRSTPNAHSHFASQSKPTYNTRRKWSRDYYNSNSIADEEEEEEEEYEYEEDEGEEQEGAEEEGEAEGAEGEEAEAEGAEAEGAEAEGAEAEGAEAEGAEAEGAEAEGVEAEAAETEGGESEGAQAKGAETEGAEAEGAGTEGAEAEGAEAEGAVAEAKGTETAEGTGDVEGGETKATEASETAKPDKKAKSETAEPAGSEPANQKVESTKDATPTKAKEAPKTPTGAKSEGIAKEYAPVKQAKANS